MSEISIFVIHQPWVDRSDREGQGTPEAHESEMLQTWLTPEGSALVFSATIHVLGAQSGGEATELPGAAWDPRAALPRVDPGELSRVEAMISRMIGSVDGPDAPLTGCSRAVLYNGLGRYVDARGAAESACAQSDGLLLRVALTELIEANVRSGMPGAATDRLRMFEVLQRDGQAPAWAAGLLARSRALLAEGSEVEAHHRDALDLLAGSGIGPELARGHLVYGEWLRRQGRRVDARVHLRAAEEIFTDSGMDGFAERTQREFAATGLTVRKRSVETRFDLTPQEAQIARLASDGQTNAEIAAELFISARTVEWHLRKVFTKLGVTSRRQLRHALPTLGHALTA